MKLTGYWKGGIWHLRPVHDQWGVPDGVRYWLIAVVVGVGLAVALSIFVWVIGG